MLALFSCLLFRVEVDNPGYLDPSQCGMKPRLEVMRLIAPLPCFISARVVFLSAVKILSAFLEDSM